MQTTLPRCGSFANRGGGAGRRTLRTEQEILRQFDPSERTLRRLGVDTADDAAMKVMARTTADDIFTISLDRAGGAMATNSRLATGTGALKPVTREIAEMTAGRVAGKEVAHEALERGRSKSFQDVWSKRWISGFSFKTRS